jgi:RNA polymerase sigma-70 factor (ECF subfamily)
MEKPPELDPATQFRELYEREYRSVYRTVRAMVFDSSLAEDLAQEAFVRAYRSRDKYRPTGPVGAWLHRIEAKTLLEKGLARLSPKVRAAVVLHYFHGYTRDEVGKILGIPSGTVASRIAKAMVVMRDELLQNEQIVIPARSGE